MNLVSLLVAAAIVKMTYGDDSNTALRIAIAVVAAAVIVVAVYISKRRPIAIGDADEEVVAPPATA